jgi:hypothetical protein
VKKKSEKKIRSVKKKSEKKIRSVKKKSEKKIQQETKKLLRDIETLREKAQQEGLGFSSLSEEELVKKIRGETSNSPFLLALTWTQEATPGDICSFSVLLYNPGTEWRDEHRIGMYLSVFFGLTNFIEDIGVALSLRDTQWPILTSQPIDLEVEEGRIITLNYTIPTDVPLTTHFGTVVFWQLWMGTTGEIFNRYCFPVSLV